jgi:transposase-like protein
MARRSAVATVQWLSRRDLPQAAAAGRIGLVSRTLRSWKEQWQEDRLKPRARGRPVERPDRDVRSAILSLFALIGPEITVEQLREIFPEVSRAELR